MINAIEVWIIQMKMPNKLIYGDYQTDRQYTMQANHLPALTQMKKLPMNAPEGPANYLPEPNYHQILRQGYWPDRMFLLIYESAHVVACYRLYGWEQPPWLRYNCLCCNML
jgi:hypothetical protein